MQGQRARGIDDLRPGQGVGDRGAIGFAPVSVGFGDGLARRQARGQAGGQRQDQSSKARP